MQTRIILLIFFCIFSTVPLNAEEFTPSFKNFYLGQSYAQIEAELKKNQVLIKTEQIKHFRLDFPLFLYLNTLERKGLNLDSERERIYVDDYHFFDFREFVLNNEKIDFFYRKDFYYLVLKELESFPVDYPSRINPHLRKLKFKFFRKKLYSIEYEAQLKKYQISRLQENYQEKYGVKLDSQEKKFVTEEGIYIVHLNPEKEWVKVIVTSNRIYKDIEKTLDEHMSEVLGILLDKIDERMEIGENLKKLVFQKKKRLLKKRIRKIYQKVDEL